MLKSNLLGALRAGLVLIFALGLGCGGESSTLPRKLDAGPDVEMSVDMAQPDQGQPDVSGPQIKGLPNLEGGNPLVPEVAMYPFPSDFYLAKDEKTRTGFSFVPALPALPRFLNVEMFAGIDGFSRIPLITTYLPGGVDPQSLPDPAKPEATLADDAAVFLVEADSGQRVPALVEVDMNAKDDGERALLIRPLRTLKLNTSHVVLITNKLRTAAGSPHEPNQAFVALRDGLSTDLPELESQREGFEVVRKAWEAQGLQAQDMVQGWSFHTRSEEVVVNTLLKMQRVASEYTIEGYTLTKDELDDRNRQIVGTFKAPNFVNAEGYIELDDHGEPKQFGMRDVEFVLTIPLNIDGPRPLIIFGHGFFYEKIEATRSSFNDLCVQGRFSAAAVDFEGFDEASAGSSISLLTDKITQVDKLIAKQQQAYTHFTALARLVKERLAQDLERTGQAPFKVIDPAQVHYMGISNGATFGAVIAATSPEFERAALVVGGLVHFLGRAQSWNGMGVLFKRRWPRALDLQLLMSLLQHKFDPIDSLNYALHLVNDRFDGLKPIKVALHMAVHDSLVNNMLTDMVARTAGIPMISPSPRVTWGVEAIEAPAEAGAPEATAAALFVYDEQLTPTVLNNTAPKVDNGAHESVRKLDVYKSHIIEFIEHGRFKQVCDGACDPN